ncbi:Uncharacterised protein [Salmonella enterica subsp. arizonae]|uniref:Uncharacterized protein n=1 Tax=Salmonella enterica subsp. arizonae TaxID=59203 RepID=A0A3S4G0K0_SALER|nr:Uncharacterised protein [Salmonella enterica subsp. arizonae]
MFFQNLLFQKNGGRPEFLMLLTKEALNSMMLFSEPKPSQYPDGNDHVMPSVEYMNDVFRTVVIFLVRTICTGKPVYRHLAEYQIQHRQALQISFHF